MTPARLAALRAGLRGEAGEAGELADLSARGIDDIVARVVPPAQRRFTGVAEIARRDELRRELRALLERGRALLERLDADDAADLDAADATALEAVIGAVDRPALRIANGSFEPPPARWAVLDAERAGIEQVIASTGRIQHAGGAVIGTGFLVGDDLVMTNGHVAAAFTEAAGERWVLRVGPAPQIDWRGEHDIREQAEFAIVEVVFASRAADRDVAVLRIDRDHPRGVAPPVRPLALATRPPDPAIERRPVYVVGYPTADRGETPPDVLRRIFADIYGSKRLQPGELGAIDAAARRVDHDCSTLGGNSGSPVVDLHRHEVVGLHFRGAYRRANSAIAVWRLAEDPDLSRLGLSFVRRESDS